jgi:hypothetical protein
VKRLIAVAFFVFVFSSNALFAIPIDATMTDFDEIFLGSGGLAVYGTFEFTIENQTSEEWTDFHLRDGDPIGGISLATYIGPGTVSFDSNFQIDIVGLSIPVGESLEFALDETCFGEICSLGGALWFAFPTTDGGGEQPVPTPGTLSLVLVSLALMRRHKRRS